MSYSKHQKEKQEDQRDTLYDYVIAPFSSRRPAAARRHKPQPQLHAFNEQAPTRTYTDATVHGLCIQCTQKSAVSARGPIFTVLAAHLFDGTRLLEGEEPRGAQSPRAVCQSHAHHGFSLISFFLDGETMLSMRENQ